jgi:hypothetical protein
MYTFRATYIIILILLGATGSIGIYYLQKYINDTTHLSLYNKFDEYQKRIIEDVQLNIIELKTNLLLSGKGINELYSNILDSNISLNNFHTLAKDPQKYINLKFLRTYYAIILNDPNEATIFLHSLIKIYNNPNYQLYNNFNGTRTLISINTTSYPLLMIFVSDPVDSIPILTKFGSINMVGLNGYDKHEILSLINSNDLTLLVTRIVNLVRIDGITEKTVTMGTIIYPWIGFVDLVPVDFLTPIFDKYIDRVNVKITSDNDVIYSTKSYKVNNLYNVVQNISFSSRNWTIEISALNTFIDFYTSDDYTIILTISIIFLCSIFILITVLGECWFKITQQNNLKYELISSKKIQSIQQSNRMILHEIRNLSNGGYSLCKMHIKDVLPNKHVKIAFNSFDAIINLTNNILDFELLLSGNYVQKIVNINIVEIINACIGKYPCVTYELSHNDIPQIIATDSIKMQEILLNGISNATKYGSDDMVRIRYQTINNLLLIEIINKVNDDQLTPNYFDDKFIPYFMKDSKNPHMWDDTIKALLQPDVLIIEQIKSYLGTDNLKHQHIVALNSNGIADIRKNMKSTGLGLSVSRLIAKALGGDSGIYYDETEKIVNFWCVIKYHSPKLEI